jgi:hypothetical protein
MAEVSNNKIQPVILYFILNDQPNESEFAKIKSYIVPRIGEFVHINVKDIGWTVYEVIRIRHFIFDEVTWDEGTNMHPMVNIYVKKFEY